MSFDFLDRRSAERFAELLDETTGARRHHHNRGRADEELAELVAIGHSLSAVRPGVRVDAEFRDGLRAMLVATAEREGIGATATPAETEAGGGHVAVREPRRALFGRASGRRFRARGAIVIGVATGAMAVSGISAASENATPGDALYGVKRSTERAQLAMAGSDLTRGQLSLDFARNRLAEAAAMGANGDFPSVLDDMDADTRQGVRLLNRSAVSRRDPATLTRVNSFVDGQRITLGRIEESLNPANRTRASRSLHLLDQVEQRTENLRAGLACSTVSQRGTDTLGPELRGCLTGTPSAPPAGKTPGPGGKPDSKPLPAGADSKAVPHPERTVPTVGPDIAGQASEPDAGVPSTGTSPLIDPSPVPSLPAVPGAEDEDEGLLGGVS